MPYMANGRLNAEDRVNMDAAAARATRDLIWSLVCTDDVAEATDELDLVVRVEVSRARPIPASPKIGPGVLYVREQTLRDALEAIRIEES